MKNHNLMPGFMVKPVRGNFVTVWSDIEIVASRVENDTMMIGMLNAYLKGYSLVVSVDKHSDRVLLWSTELQRLVWTYGSRLETWLSSWDCVK